MNQVGCERNCYHYQGGGGRGSWGGGAWIHQCEIILSFTLICISSLSFISLDLNSLTEFDINIATPLVRHVIQRRCSDSQCWININIFSFSCSSHVKWIYFFKVICFFSFFAPILSLFCPVTQTINTILSPWQCINTPCDWIHCLPSI